MQVTHISAPIASINSQFTLIAINLTRVRVNFSSICEQLFLTRTLPAVLMIFPNIATSVDDVSVDVTTIPSQLAIVSANFTPVSS